MSKFIVTRSVYRPPSMSSGMMYTSHFDDAVDEIEANYFLIDDGCLVFDNNGYTVAYARGNWTSVKKVVNE